MMKYLLQLLVICILVTLLFSMMCSKSQTPPKLIKHSFKNNDYVIYEIKNVLTQAECNLIINTSKNSLVRSSVISNEPISDVRTSENTFLHKTTEPNKLNNVLQKIDHLTAKISGKPIENQESLQVVRYQPNQQYKGHYDCCIPHDSELCIEDYKRHGFRHSTFLLYLNDVESGGETEFPLLNHKFKPKMGCGIFFFNLVRNESKYHPLSKHAGLPPLKGDKWVCNKWIRTRKY